MAPRRLTAEETRRPFEPIGDRALPERLDRKRSKRQTRYVRAIPQKTKGLRESRSPVALLNDLVARRLDPKDLSVKQRRAILLLQINGKHTTGELASLLQVRPAIVRRDMSEIRKEIGKEVTEWSLEEVVGGMVMRAERCQAQAMKDEDPALAWSIERDKVKLLKELGVIGGSAGSGFKLTLEVLGQGYERARLAMEQLDPVLTGEVVEVAGEVREPGAPRVLPALDLPAVLPETDKTPAP